jgi:hypothetical protein
MIVMQPPMMEFMRAGMSTELIYSFVIILCGLMIYFGTRKLYALSSHRGIKYFREAFLFFSIAYFFRSFIKFIVGYFGIDNIWSYSHRLLGHFTLVLFIYFSTLAILYLAYSVFYKKTDKDLIFYIHGLALLIAIISALVMNPFIHLVIYLVLFIILAFSAYFAHKKKSKMYFVYILLFIFWIINILDILIPNVFKGLQLFIYLISLGIFLLIVYKVLKRSGA